MTIYYVTRETRVAGGAFGIVIVSCSHINLKETFFSNILRVVVFLSSMFRPPILY